ncbi:MAG: NUDIX hydrolase [Rhodothermales bacterium]
MEPRSSTDSHITEAYGNRVRVRVGGLLFDDEAAPSSVLLVEHAAMHTNANGEAPPFWIAPGGGVDFGEALPEALRREVEEETGLRVHVGPLRYVLDFIRPPLHAVSFYFHCTIDGGTLRTGADPELGERQLIRSVDYVSFERLPGLNIYPKGFAERLPADARTGFPNGITYLGTLR